MTSSLAATLSLILALYGSTSFAQNQSDEAAPGETTTSFESNSTAASADEARTTAPLSSVETVELEPALRLAEPVFQPGAQKTAVQLKPSYSAAFERGHATALSNRQLVGYSLAYGFSKNFAMTVSSDYGQDKYSEDGYSSIQKGSSDIALDAQLAAPVGDASMILIGAGYAFSPEHAQYSSSGKTTNSNRYSGGTAGTVRLGAQFDLTRASQLGFLLQGTFAGPYKVDYGNTTYTSRETTFTWSQEVFAQIALSETFALGGLIDYSREADFGALAPGVFALVDVKRVVQIVPTVSYATLIDPEATRTVDRFTGSVKARVQF